MDGPVFANRTGAWMSLTNMRRSLRAALPADLSWMTPQSLRRTVATVVRDARGPAQAQQQLSHAKLTTTEAYYLQRQTRGPDVRAVLDKYAGGNTGPSRGPLHATAARCAHSGLRSERIGQKQLQGLE